MSSGSLGVVGFIVAHHVGQKIHSGTFGCALGVIEFIQGRRVAPWGLSGSSFVAWLIAVCPGGRRAHLVSLGSLECVLLVVGCILVL